MHSHFPGTRAVAADEDHDLALQLAQQAHGDAQLALRRMQSAKARMAADDAQAAARALHDKLDAYDRRTGSGGTR